MLLDTAARSYKNQRKPSPYCPVALIGGSFGAMLGAQIIAKYPESVEKAALFSGDLTSDWLANGWLRFDNIIQTIGLKKPKFSQDMQQLLDNASIGSLTIRAQNLSSVLRFEIIPGWSHDFGPEPNIGISKVGQMIKDLGL